MAKQQAQESGSIAAIRAAAQNHESEIRSAVDRLTAERDRLQSAGKVDKTTLKALDEAITTLEAVCEGQSTNVLAAIDAHMAQESRQQQPGASGQSVTAGSQADTGMNPDGTPTTGAQSVDGSQATAPQPNPVAPSPVNADGQPVAAAAGSADNAGLYGGTMTPSAAGGDVGTTVSPNAPTAQEGSSAD